MIRKYLFLFTLVTFLSVPVWAQSDLNLEVGVKTGVGGYGYSESSEGSRAVLGLEVCAFCAGRFALFGDYSASPAHRPGAEPWIRRGIYGGSRGLAVLGPAPKNSSWEGLTPMRTFFLAGGVHEIHGCVS
jgi:hypothetical protein